MHTKTEDRLLGAALAALLATIGGELLGSQLLISVGVAGFVLALTTLFAVMGLVLAASVVRKPDLTALDSAVAGRTR